MSPSSSVAMKSPHLRSSNPRRADSPPVSTSRRSRGQNLSLNSLPRFHPANFPSGSSSLSNTSSNASSAATSPPSNLNSPQPTPPPVQHQQRPQHARQISDAKRQLYSHHRDLVNMNRVANTPRSPPSSSGQNSPGPSSPRLNPLGSPGPVTPLELEEGDGYFFGHEKNQLHEDSKDEIVERFMQKGGANPTSPNSSRGKQGKNTGRGHRAVTNGNLSTENYRGNARR